MSMWLYLHYPALQLDSLYTVNTSQAVVIVHGRKNEVVQLNAEASSQGVKVGMGLGTASALCAELMVHAYNKDVEVNRLKELSHCLYLVTSDISFFEPQGLLLRVSNMLSLYGGLDAYWRVLQQHLLSMNVSYNFATAGSPLAARLLAKAGLNCLFPDSSTALKHVRKQPLSLSELSSKTVSQLARVGVNTLDDLLNMPLAEVARRFDIDVVNYVGRVTGQFKHPVQFYHPPDIFERYLELLFDVENTQWLEKPLLKLLNELQTFLILRDKLAYELRLALHQRDSADQHISVSAATGEYHAEKWQVLFSLRLESVVLEAPVTGITLKVIRIAERQSENNDLFDGQRGGQTAQDLISILQAKLGTQAVQGLTLSDDPRPHLASQYCEPLTPTSHISIDPHLVRPSILLPVPKRLEVKVSILHGPERIVTGWWDNKPLHRDYFVALANDGKCLWIYRNQKQQWFVHGVFS